MYTRTHTHIQLPSLAKDEKKRTNRVNYLQFGINRNRNRDQNQIKINPSHPSSLIRHSIYQKSSRTTPNGKKKNTKPSFGLLPTSPSKRRNPKSSILKQENRIHHGLTRFSSPHGLQLVLPHHRTHLHPSRSLLCLLPTAQISAPHTRRVIPLPHPQRHPALQPHRPHTTRKPVSPPRAQRSPRPPLHLGSARLESLPVWSASG